MTIGFDGSRAFTQNRTGTENYSYHLLKNLARIDHKNQYIIYIRSGLASQGWTLRGWPSNFQFSIINFPRLWTQLGLAWHTFIDPIDVLFVPAHTVPLIRKPGLKTVMTVHDLGSEYLPKMHQLKQRLYLGFITKFQFKSVSKLIAVSKSTKNDLVKKAGVNPQKIEVVYEGVDRKLFKPVKGLSRAKSRDDALIYSLKQFGLSPYRYFLFVGTIQPRKNLINLIDGYDSYFGPFDNVPKLILAGSKGWLSEEIYAHSRLLSLEDKVKFIGRVSDQQLVALYSGAIALVCPSRYEGFGLPILEALACGCPVITSPSSSMPEVGGKAAIYIKDPLNCNSIAEAMSQLLIREDVPGSQHLSYQKTRSYQVNQKERVKWVSKGQAQLKKFSWDKCAQETLKVFQKLCQR